MKYKSSFVTAHQKRLLRKERNKQVVMIVVGTTLMWLTMAIPVMYYS